MHMDTVTLAGIDGAMKRLVLVRTEGFLVENKDGSKSTYSPFPSPLDLSGDIVTYKSTDIRSLLHCEIR